MQSVKLCSEEDPRIVEWLNKKTDKCTSPDIQNEMLNESANHPRNRS